MTRLVNQSKIVEKLQLAKEKLEQAVPDTDGEPLSYSQVKDLGEMITFRYHNDLDFLNNVQHYEQLFLNKYYKENEKRKKRR